MSRAKLRTQPSLFPQSETVYFKLWRPLEMDASTKNRRRFDWVFFFSFLQKQNMSTLFFIDWNGKLFLLAKMTRKKKQIHLRSLQSSLRNSAWDSNSNTFYGDAEEGKKKSKTSIEIGGTEASEWLFVYSHCYKVHGIRARSYVQFRPATWWPSAKPTLTNILSECAAYIRLFVPFNRRVFGWLYYLSYHHLSIFNFVRQSFIYLFTFAAKAKYDFSIEDTTSPQTQFRSQSHQLLIPITALFDPLPAIITHSSPAWNSQIAHIICLSVCVIQF